MSAKKIIVVFGALGNQGGSVIDSILNDPDTAEKFEIHGATRDPAKPSALALAERGVKVVKASLEDIESLRLIVKGAYAVFAVTNWNEIMDMDREIQQGKNIADVSKEYNVQHLIWSTTPYVSKISNNKYTKVHHLDGKAIVEEYIRTLGIPATFLQLGIFMHFLLHYIVPTSPGAKSYQISFPLPTNSKFPMIQVKKDTGNYVKTFLLNREKFLGKRISAAENEYSMEDIVSTLKTVGGLDMIPPICNEDGFKEQMAALGAPEWWQDDLVENGKFMQEYGLFGGAEIDNGPDVLSEPLETFSEWVAKSPEIAVLK